MRSSALAPRNTRRLMSLVSTLVILAVFAGPAVAHALGAPASTTSSSVALDATTSSTTATNQSTTSSVTAAAGPGQGTQAGLTDVIPPASTFFPLNAGWKTDQMVVQVWPEYDRNAVLVLMSFSLPADVPLPATFKFAIPRGALIAGIGEVDPSGQYKYNYGTSYPPVTPGTDWDVVTIQVQDYRSLQIDYYYDPGLPTGAGDRSFPVLFQVPVDVTTLLLHIQQPARATNFKVQPAPQGLGASNDGFTYAVSTFSDVKAGSTLGELVSYSKPDGGLSTDSSQATAPRVNTTTVLLAAILIIVVCAVGVIAYRLYRSSRAGAKGRPRTRRGPAARPTRSSGPRPEKSSPTKSARGSTARPEKGPAAKPSRSSEVTPRATDTQSAAATDGDETFDEGDAVTGLCVACGEELPKKARFCPNCGEAQAD
jgi:hypothetical protein